MSDFAAFIKDYGPAIAWVIAAIGWAVANFQANRREVRKEVRAEIDELTKLAKETLLDLQNYYKTEVGSDDSDRYELVIKARFKELDMRFDRLHSRKHLEHFPTGGLVAGNEARERFFDLSTFHHFETSSRPSPKERSSMLLKQMLASLALTEALQLQFINQFD